VGGRGREAQAPVERQRGAQGLDPQAGDCDRVGVALDPEGLGAPLEVAELTGDGEPVGRVAQARRREEGHLHHRGAPRLERRLALAGERRCVEERLRRNRGHVHLEADRPVALERAAASREDPLPGERREIEPPPVRARVEREIGQRRAVERRPRDRGAGRAGRGGRRAPERDLRAERAVEAAERLGDQRQPRPREAARRRLRLDAPALPVPPARAQDTPPGQLRLEALHDHARPFARGRERDRGRLLAVARREGEPGREVRAGHGGVPRPLDAESARDRAVALEPERHEERRQPERLGLAPQVPRAGVRERGERSGDGRLSRRGPQDERREREPSPRVAHRPLERVGLAVEGEPLGPHLRVDLRRRGAPRHLARRDELARPGLRPPALGAEVREQGIDRLERQPRAPRAPYASGRHPRVGGHPRAVRGDARAFEHEGGSLDPQAARAGEGERGGVRRPWCTGRRAQRDLAAAAARLDVPAGGRPGERRVGARRHLDVGAGESAREGGHVDPLGPQADLRPRALGERERPLGHDPAAEPRAASASTTSRGPSIRPRPSSAHGPTPATESAGDVTATVPATRPPAASTVASTRPSTSVPGRARRGPPRRARRAPRRRR
jgi:hypothetical protein